MASLGTLCVKERRSVLRSAVTEEKELWNPSRVWKPGQRKRIVRRDFLGVANADGAQAGGVVREHGAGLPLFGEHVEFEEEVPERGVVIDARV